MVSAVVTEALAGTKPEKLSAVSVCKGPGLIGSLLVGCSFAKAVAYSKKLPLVGVNHLEGHILSAFLGPSRPPEFPFIALLASGGHTSLYEAQGFLNYSLLGATRDDAAGEAYDKVAKLLGLGYPGGPAIDELAACGNPGAIKFPRAYLPGGFDFSFSGLKTAVVNFLRENPPGGSSSFDVKDLAASFQAAVVDVLIRKSEWAITRTGIKRLVVAGGVASNSGLKSKMLQMGRKKEIEVFIPPPEYCTDNAAMIALAGWQHLLASDTAGLDLNPKAYLPL
jgi:N6-L-threonylcarbamoyladenine synthase